MSKKRFLKGSAEHKVERRRFLTQLVHEYSRTNSKEAKLQVMANLANFAYDPYNFEFFRELKVTDLFLYEIDNGKNATLVEFAMGGLCNCSADEALREEMINHGGIPLITKFLSADSCNTATLISAIGALHNLVTPSNRFEILTTDLRTSLEQILSTSQDQRIRNLATIFLNDNFPTSAPRVLN